VFLADEAEKKNVGGEGVRRRRGTALAPRFLYNDVVIYVTTNCV